MSGFLFGAVTTNVFLFAKPQTSNKKQSVDLMPFCFVVIDRANRDHGAKAEQSLGHYNV